MKYQVVEIKDGKIKSLVPLKATIFDNKYDAICLMHELNMIFGPIHTVIKK